MCSEILWVIFLVKILIFFAVVIAVALLYHLWSSSRSEKRARQKDKESAVLSSIGLLTQGSVVRATQVENPGALEAEHLEGVARLVVQYMLAWSDDGVRDEVKQLRNRYMQKVTDALLRSGVDPDSLGLDQLGARLDADFSKFSWKQGAPILKIKVIEHIAEEWATRNNCSSKEQFETGFGEELRRAVGGDRSEEFDSQRLLSQISLQAGPRGVLLDGKDYRIDWRVGFNDHRVGTEIHLPIINYFMGQGYPIKPAK